MSEIAKIHMKGWMHEWLIENKDYMTSHNAEEINLKLITDSYQAAMKALETITKNALNPISHDSI